MNILPFFLLLILLQLSEFQLVCVLFSVTTYKKNNLLSVRGGTINIL